MASPDEPLVRFERVTKRFGARSALADVSFAVAPGAVVALLGPNGAGKSTAFALMLGHLVPDAGTVTVHARDVRRDRRRALARTGVVPESPAFFEYLTGWENLCCLASYSGAVDPAEARDAVAFVGLTARIDDPVRAYSRGMRQRLAVAQALVPTPDLVLLDEPAEGLDPEGIADVHALIARLRRERGVTVVMASHLLAEAEAVADRVVVLAAGRVAADEAIGAGATVQRVRLTLDDWTRAAPVLAAAGAAREGDDVVVVAAGLDVGALVTALVGHGVVVRAVEPVRSTLRERYLGRAWVG